MPFSFHFPHLDTKSCVKLTFTLVRGDEVNGSCNGVTSAGTF